MSPLVESFYDPATATFTYVVYDHEGGRAAIIDPVLDFDLASASISTISADRVLEFAAEQDLSIDWILETHAHADHLTAAAYLKEKTGAPVAIGRGIVAVQARFKTLFGLADLPADGSQFDRLFDDGDTFDIGQLEARAIATPGHTDDSLSYLIGDVAFIGDTMFAPETGTARVDFPGGDARKLYHSIQKLLALPASTRIFLCHDYPKDRAAQAETSVEEQNARNVHVNSNTSEDDFVRRRTEHDATLAPPKLILPALQVNIRAGQLPEPDANGVRYLRLPLNQLGVVS